MAGSLIVRGKPNGSAGKQAINIYMVLSPPHQWGSVLLRALPEREGVREEPFRALCVLKNGALALQSISEKQRGGETQAVAREAETRKCCKKMPPNGQTWQPRHFSFSITLAVTARFHWKREVAPCGPPHETPTASKTHPESSGSLWSAGSTELFPAVMQRVLLQIPHTCAWLNIRASPLQRGLAFLTSGHTGSEFAKPTICLILKTYSGLWARSHR